MPDREKSKKELLEELDSLRELCARSEEELERLRASEQDLRESADRFRELAELLPESIFEFDTRGIFTFANRNGFARFGYTPEELGSVSCLELIVPEDRPKAIENIQACLVGGKMNSNRFTGKTKDGATFPITIHSAPIVRGDEIVGVRGIVIDITELHQAQREAETALEERGLLLREIHHRVRNNLQIISSLLRLKARKAQNDTLVDLLRDVEHRIMSMALAHDKLYDSGSFATLDLRDYVQSVIQQVSETYGSDIPVRASVADLDLGIDTAIPLGLIISELLSNCIKYAFPHQRRGHVTVNIEPGDDDCYQLEVTDQGEGAPEGLDFHSEDFPGLQFVSILAGQIGGEAFICRNGGTRVCVTFREVDKSGTD